MRKILTALIFFSCAVHGFAQNAAENAPLPLSDKIQPSLEMKAGYFFFANSTMREIYKHGGYDLQLAGSYTFLRWLDRCGLDFYGSVEYLRCSGKSLGAKQRTEIWELPVNLGLKPIFAISSNAQYYFAIGPRYFYVRQTNHSDFVRKHVSRNGIGFFANTGLLFLPYSHLLIDIFAEYSYERTHIQASKNHGQAITLQVGGFTFGGGLGYSF